MGQLISIAIETSCRLGGLALGIGDEPAGCLDLDASGRHAAELIRALDRLLADAKLGPRDLDEVYVSAGPGSFTGLRIGITVARTLAQSVSTVRCVAVSTARAVAENVRDLDWKHLGVVMDAMADGVCVSLFERRGDEIVSAGRPAVMTAEQFLASAPKPLLLTGQALSHCEFHAPDVTLADTSAHLPTAAGVWRVGRQLAGQGRFTDAARLLPIYARRPEAVRLRADQQDPAGK